MATRQYRINGSSSTYPNDKLDNNGSTTVGAWTSPSKARRFHLAAWYYNGDQYPASIVTHISFTSYFTRSHGDGTFTGLYYVFIDNTGNLRYTVGPLSYHCDTYSHNDSGRGHFDWEHDVPAGSQALLARILNDFWGVVLYHDSGDQHCYTRAYTNRHMRATFTYQGGAVYRKAGGSWHRCQVYRKAGGTWHLCMPYRKAGGAWHLLG